MDTSTDAQAPVLALYQQLLHQWNKRNAAAMAGLFLPNGTLIGFDGSQLNGQQEIYSVLDEIFSNYPTAAYVSIVKDVKILNETTAILLAAVGMVAVGQTDISPEVNAIQTVTAIMDDGKWRITLFQNTPAAFHGRPELADKLSTDLRQALQSSVTQN